MPVTDPSAADLWTNLGIMAAAGIAALAGYFGPKVFGRAGTAAPTSPVLTGVGLELGTRQQTDQLIAAVNRVADAIENKKQATMEEMVREIRNDMDEMREEQRWQRPP